MRLRQTLRMTSHKFPDLIVTKVEPPNDEAASVTLTSGVSEIVVFCHPCDLASGSRVQNSLSPLDTDLLQPQYLTDWPGDERAEASKERLKRTGHFSYEGTGRVIDEALGLVLVQGFVIDFGEVPSGATHVEFKITRLDISR